MHARPHRAPRCQGNAVATLGWKGGAALRGSLRALARLLVRGPEGQVVPQQLHDQRGVLVGVLGDVVELGDRVLEGRARHLAGLVGVLQHLVLEDGVVQGEAEADGVGHDQVLLGDLRGLLVREPRALRRLGLLVAVAELGDVAVVVGLHLVVEDLRLAARRLGDEIVVQNAQDGVADLLELGLDLGAVLLGVLGLLLVALGLLLLLHARDDPPRRAAAPHGVLVGDGEEVALLDGELVRALADSLHVARHLVVALRLLGELGEVDVLLAGHGCRS
mmetsp:Transcript_84216/g.188030  ORF Transcript_84216/g.188030 Transcript_84216/m.188030 type:complete len:276 (-) Transcript_84216:81-908(-)